MHYDNLEKPAATKGRSSGTRAQPVRRSHHLAAARTGSPSGNRISFYVQQGPLGRSAIYAAIASGALKARKAGRATIILEEDWQQFLRELPPVTQSKAA